MTLPSTERIHTPQIESDKLLLRIDRATVEYDGFTLGPISIQVAEGERCVLVGRNGAGKSTLLGMLAGRVKNNSGAVRLGGNYGFTSNLVAWRSAVAYVGDARSSLPWMTVAEHFRFLERMYPDWNMQAALDLAEKLELPTLPPCRGPVIMRV